jgi:tRNA(Ile)-lysidine synthetase-like protein
VDVGRLPRELLVGFPGGGERIVTAVGRRDVKSVLREAGVPVWERASVPLVSTPQAALLAIADLWCSDDLHPVNAGARRGRFVWQQQ